MRILALNGTYRPEGTTAALVQRALEGAASVGATTEMILLRQCAIEFCRNCLSCYENLDSEIAPCVIDDDVRGILERMRDADGVVLASPVHSGFVTGLMVTFIERSSWTLLRPTGELLGLKGVPEPRLTDKTRGVAIVLSAGLVPPEFRQYCDMGTPFLREWAELALNGSVVADLYAGAEFPRELTGDEWSKAHAVRELSQRQLDDAFAIGVRLVEAIKSGQVQPYDPKRIEAALSSVSGA